MEYCRAMLKHKSLLCLVAFAVLILCCITSWRKGLLLAANFLVVSDPLHQADFIEFRSSRGAKLSLLAARLYSVGLAKRIVLDRGGYDRTIPELQTYGFKQTQEDETTLGILKFLGVPQNSIEFLDGYDSSTYEESRKVAAFAREHGFKRIVVITVNFHSRRTRMAFNRALSGTGITVSVQPVQSPNFTPDAWWTRHADVRTFFIEYPELVLYSLFHW
jgi:uncharacterized SAM-binding protein YcdF (DUF218 family)